jgi:hypothetical protein
MEPHGVAASIVLSGITAEGVEVEFPVLYVATLDDDEWISLELFDAEQRPAAIARLAELRPPEGG